MMRAWEIISEHITPSRPVTLRALHKIKHQERKQKADLDWRTNVLFPVMYARDDSREMEFSKRELELDRREITLDKREAQLDLIQQQVEQSSEAREAIRKMAKRAIDSGTG